MNETKEIKNKISRGRREEQEMGEKRRKKEQEGGDRKEKKIKQVEEKRRMV